MNTNKKNILITVLLFACFAVFTVLSVTVDVGEGLKGTTIGFSSFNHYFAEVYPYNEGYFNISEYLGYAALGVGLSFVMMGVSQLLRERSIKAVDCNLCVLCGFYAVVLAFYALFEKLAVNYRTVMLNGELKTSYPSNHTVLGICVFVTAAMMFDTLQWKAAGLKNAIRVFSVFLAIVLVITRFASGVHWFTDIVGGIILSAALVHFFITVQNFMSEK